MKALFISYNMTLTERVEGLLDHYTVRGFTLFPLTHGRGSFDGEPHMGTHTWPAMNSTIIAMVEDEKMPRVMEALRKLEKETQMQGMRAATTMNALPPTMPTGMGPTKGLPPVSENMIPALTNALIAPWPTAAAKQLPVRTVT